MRHLAQVLSQPQVKSTVVTNPNEKVQKEGCQLSSNLIRINPSTNAAFSASTRFDTNIDSSYSGWQPVKTYPKVKEDSSTRFMRFKKEFTENGNSRLKIKDLQGVILEFCRDRQGSLFIQDALDEQSEKDVAIVCNEIMKSVPSISMATFGHYVIMKLIEKISNPQMKRLINEICSVIKDLSDHKFGGRIILKAIQRCNSEQKEHLIKELCPFVEQMAKSKNPLRILLAIFDEINLNLKRILITFIKDCLLVLMRDPYGHHFIKKCIMEINDPAFLKTVGKSIIDNVSTLAVDQFGNSVLQLFIEKSDPSEIPKIIENIPPTSVLGIVKDKRGCFVVFKLFDKTNKDQAVRLWSMIFAINSIDQLLDLLETQDGVKVVSKLIEIGERIMKRREVKKYVDHISMELHKYRHGTEIMEKIEEFYQKN